MVTAVRSHGAGRELRERPRRARSRIRAREVAGVGI
jgi:hypothetical protein